MRKNTVQDLGKISSSMVLPHGASDDFSMFSNHNFFLRLLDKIWVHVCIILVRKLHYVKPTCNGSVREAPVTWIEDAKR